VTSETWSPARSDAAPTPPAPVRFERLDALRGVAIVWMAAFHFAFDLNHFRLIHENFRGDPFWTVQRTCIVTLFLLCAGIGQAVASHQGQTWARFWRRWAQVAGCAVLVSIGSALMFPTSWISFGVLHGVAVMLILVRLVAPWAWRWPLAVLAAAVVALVLPHLVGHPVFDHRFSNWVGLITRRPVTEDYVPVLPWLGVMLIGLVAGQQLLRRRPSWLTARVPWVAGRLAVLGRWSLSFYMVHQPVFIGVLMAGLWLSGRAG
jgi:uncharacterized membrane protein